MHLADGYVEFGPGRRIHYLRGGEGEPVVFLPGNGCSVEDFRPVMEVLMSRYDVLGIDLPGREPTEWPDVYFDFMSDLPSVLDWVLSVLEIGPHVMVGHSAGGMAALQHARRHGARVRALSLMEGFVNLDRHHQTVAKGSARAMRMPEPLQAAFEQRRSANAQWLNDHPRFRESFSRSQQMHDMEPWMEELKMPIQVFIGDMGQLLPRLDDLESWRHQLGMNGVKDLEVVLVPKAGHWMMLDDFEMVGQQLLAFVEQVHAYGQS